eukprot:scaffold420609_cov34-Prasinocladus_malaysianus.AAC.2
MIGLSMIGRRQRPEVISLGSSGCVAEVTTGAELLLKLAVSKGVDPVQHELVNEFVQAIVHLNQVDVLVDLPGPAARPVDGPDVTPGGHSHRPPVQLLQRGHGEGLAGNQAANLVWGHTGRSPLLEQHSAGLEDTQALWAQGESVGLQEGNVRVGVQGGDVVEAFLGPGG